jgi:hypothetical protein
MMQEGLDTAHRRSSREVSFEMCSRCFAGAIVTYRAAWDRRGIAILYSCMGESYGSKEEQYNPTIVALHDDDRHWFENLDVGRFHMI